MALPLDLDPQLNETALMYYPRLRAVREYVHAHLTNHISLADASRVAGLERKYFSAYFRAKVGISFSRWLGTLRIARAKELMRVREGSIPGLAYASGFRDVRTFERTFKRVAGVTPVGYRLSVRPDSRQVT
jgi:AraC-like DNA-binding protein